jgi:hypothetical protein
LEMSLMGIYPNSWAVRSDGSPLLLQVGSSRHAAAVAGSQQAARAARDALLQSTAAHVAVKTAEASRLLERLQFCEKELQGVGRQSAEGAAVGLGADVSAGLAAHEAAMTTQYMGDERHGKTLLAELAAAHVDSRDVVGLQPSHANRGREAATPATLTRRVP